ncbi:hypothetical protein Sjap_008732 [Stephania japonica]|uniref:Uncharacterized protein n=1 Tax=Stephania japonica TaxID=461633 RepID=A0AAP0JRP4_9MAGN
MMSRSVLVAAAVEEGRWWLWCRPSPLRTAARVSPARVLRPSWRAEESPIMCSESVGLRRPLTSIQHQLRELEIQKPPTIKSMTLSNTQFSKFDLALGLALHWNILGLQVLEF